MNGKEVHCTPFLRGLWPVIASFLLGSVLTIGGLLLDREVRTSLPAVAFVFFGVCGVLFMAYRFLLKRYLSERLCHVQRLSQSEQYIDAILESMPYGLLVVDAQCRVKAVNRMLLQWTGYDKAALLGQDAEKLFHSSGQDDDSLLTQDQIRSRILDGMLEKSPLLLLTSQETSLPVEATTNFARYGNETSSDIILMLGEPAVAPKPTPPTQTQPGANNDILANISQEFRPALSLIVGQAEQLLVTSTPPDTRDKLRTIAGAAQGMLGLLNEMRDLIRLESGQMHPERISFPLRVTLENLSDLIATRAHAKDLELYCYIAPDTPDRLVGDPGALARILLDLIATSIRCTESGEVTLLVQPAGVSHAMTNSAEVVLTFTIADTGLGLPWDRPERIFDPLQITETPDKRKAGCMGLGLSIGKRLVEMLGGQIRVESEAGEGTVFHVTLGFGKGRNEESLASEAEVTTPLMGVRALVVDKNPMGCVIAMEMLQGLGADAEEVEDPTALPAILDRAREQERPWDVLIVDQKALPEEGMAQLAEWQQHAGWSGKLLVLLPCHLSAARPAFSADFGEMLSLHKPLKRTALLRAILALLERPVDMECADETFLAGDAAPSPLRILLVEELEENRQLAASILERAGHTAVGVKECREALERLTSEGRFDLIVLDLNLPEMDGYELTRLLRTGGGPHAEVPIVGVTARDLPGERDLCLSSGMQGYLVKPYRPVALLNVTAKAYLKHRNHESATGGVMREASSLYLKGPRLLLQGLRAALEEKNPKRAREEIEEIRQLATTLGTDRIRLCASHMGTAIRADEWPRAQRLYKELEAECVCVYEMLMDRLP
ncbi:MAG: response regulator [Magnetococcales bacterium]|nr:response regulator [Magnetococcales bacterium]